MFDLSDRHCRPIVASVAVATLGVFAACGGSGGESKGSGNCLDRGCKISARDGVAGENFGSAVAVRGRLVVVGAPNDDEEGVDAGAAYVYRVGRRNAEHEQKLTAEDAAEGDTLGRSVAMGSEDLIVVGSWKDDDNGDDSGAVYVFRRVGDRWSEEQKLLALDGDEGDRFGRSVAADEDVIVVGADLDEENGVDSGSAYVFRFDGVDWSQEKKLTASDGAAEDDFGDSVSIDDDVIVVGAGADDDAGENSGAAYVFRYNGVDWVEEQKLIAADGAAFDEFGDPVSVHGDVIVAGADDDDDRGDNSGSVYVYRFDGASWAEEQKLTASDGVEDDDFGESIAVTQDLIGVGAIGDDDDGSRSGSVYLFRFDGASWMETKKLVARDASRSDEFGNSLGIDADVVVVGARGEDGRGDESGAAYVFER